MMGSFIICIFHDVLPGWPNKGRQRTRGSWNRHV